MSSQNEPDRGSWLPRHVAERLARLDLRRPSSWRVFLAVLTTSARYGGRDALLGVDDLARMTGLGARTVKLALSELLAAGLVERVGRAGRLRAPMLHERPEAAVPPAFTARQRAAVTRALREASLLLGRDAGLIALDADQAAAVGLEAGVTLRDAQKLLEVTADRRRTMAFVGLVLGLRHGAAVAGEPMT
jgi:hypothetical protein